MASYINKLGMINALGNGAEEVANHLLHNNQSGIVPYSHLFTERTAFVGQVSAPLVSIPPSLAQLDCRNNRLLATTYQQIAAKVERLKQTFGAHRIGVVLGTSTSGISDGEAAFAHYQRYQTFPAAFDYAQQEPGTGSEFLAAYAGVTGVNYTISTACSSSGKALAAADRLLQAELCDAVITGGCDTLCELTLNGFDALELVAPNICNPFSQNRNGLNIGEGATLFILSREPASIQLIGIGESSDGYHVSAPEPTGLGAKLAMKQALASANLRPDDIGYLNLHGTATVKNDAMESLAVNEIFPHAPFCSSTKPLTGHTLGAAAAQEVGLCCLLLSEYNPQQTLPAHLFDGQTDPSLPTLNLVPESCTFDKPIFMSNSFAFGGSNISLIIEKI